MAETLNKPEVTISEMTVDDVEGMTRMHVQSWLDTYVSVENDVTEDWIRNRFKDRLTPEGIEKRKERWNELYAGTGNKSFVAKDKDGKIIGMSSWRRDEEGNQHVGAVYVDKKFHGKGVAYELMGRVLECTDAGKPLYLEVATYNDRAIAFYKKYGFEPILGSEKLFDDKIPEITMVREAQQS